MTLQTDDLRRHGASGGRVSALTDPAALERCAAATEIAKRLRDDPELQWAYADAAALARRPLRAARRGARYALRAAAAAALVAIAVLLGTAPRPIAHGDATEPTAAEPTLAAAVARATNLIGAAQVASSTALLPGDVVVDAHSIAVLPFTPDGDTPSPQDSDLAARLQRDLTAALGAIPGVYAIDEVSARAYAGADLAPAAIGAQLGARAVMTGHLAVADGRIRIAAVLRDAATNAILWRHDYDDALAALSAIQVDIVDAVTTALVYAPRYDATVAALERAH